LTLWGFLYTWRQNADKNRRWFWLGWLLLIYAPYTGVVFSGAYRALTNVFSQTWGFFASTRYLFPLTLPFVFLIVAYLNRQSQKSVLVLTAVYPLITLSLFFISLNRSALIAGLG
jgi:hypothetical protein